MDLYQAIKKQRKTIIAPVDTISPCKVAKYESDDIRKYQILIALLLSSQTKDEVTFAAITSLNEVLGVLTPRNVLNAKEEDLRRSISKVGFNNRKLKYLIEVSKRVVNKMPETLEETLKLPGIGYKMAYLYLQHACGFSEGVGVDTHVHRITNRIGLISTKTAEQSEKELQKIFDRDEWMFVNNVFVGFGQMICKAIKPQCEKCCIKDRCPYYNNVKK